MSRLFNASSSQNFVNQTSSEIVATLGNEAGLAVQADPTTTIVGQYYQLEHARTALNAFTRFTTALDVITYLAQLEGYDCWVKGSTLYFMRPGLNQRSVVIDVSRLTSGVGSPIPISRLRFDRRTAFDTGACVTVKSWNSRQRIAVEASYPQSSAGASFVFVAPNLLDDSASQRAQTLQRDIARHGMTVTGETTQWPGFDVRDQLQILNSNGWDGSYIVDNVTKQVSGRRGFTQTFAAHVQ
jgi:hypothetical protein